MNFATSIIMSVIVALLVSMTTFAGKVQKGEPFDFVKLVRTLLIGLVLGAVAGFSGFDLTAENWEMYAAANAGAVAIVDQLFKAGMRVVMPKAATYELSMVVVLILMTVGYAIGWVNHVGKAEPAAPVNGNKSAQVESSAGVIDLSLADGIYSAPHAALDPADIPEL